jgi:hypothetical protein
MTARPSIARLVVISPAAVVVLLIGLGQEVRLGASYSKSA